MKNHFYFTFRLTFSENASLLSKVQVGLEFVYSWLYVSPMRQNNISRLFWWQSKLKQQMQIQIGHREVVTQIGALHLTSS